MGRPSTWVARASVAGIAMIAACSSAAPPTETTDVRASGAGGASPDFSPATTTGSSVASTSTGGAPGDAATDDASSDTATDTATDIVTSTERSDSTTAVTSSVAGGSVACSFACLIQRGPSGPYERTFDDAKLVCTVSHGHLARVSRGCENALATERVLDLVEEGATTGAATSVWLGYRVVNGELTDDAGEPLAGAYHNLPAPPASLEDGCVALVATGEWARVDCSGPGSERPWLCCGG